MIPNPWADENGFLPDPWTEHAWIRSIYKLVFVFGTTAVVLLLAILVLVALHVWMHRTRRASRKHGFEVIESAANRPARAEIRRHRHG